MLCYERGRVRSACHGLRLFALHPVPLFMNSLTSKAGMIIIGTLLVLFFGIVYVNGQEAPKNETSTVPEQAGDPPGLSRSFFEDHPETPAERQDRMNRIILNQIMALRKDVQNDCR